jgi:hypothetical protein
MASQRKMVNLDKSIIVEETAILTDHRDLDFSHPFFRNARMPERH